MSTELIKSVSIENLLSVRAGVLDRFKQAVELLQQASDMSGGVGLGFPDVGMALDGGRNVDHRISGSYRELPSQLLAAATVFIDAGAWGYLMRESGLLSLMDATARREWGEKLQSRENVPELTDANIRATFLALHESRADMFERGVLNVFKSLSWHHKTNQPFLFGKRLVIGGVMHRYGGGAKAWLSVNYGRANLLDDLDRVMHLLDGKPEPDHRSGWSSRLHRVGQRGGVVEGDFFSLRVFKNSNAHCTFKRLDLVEKMNKILAKHFPNALACERRE